jgi:hypothetical protein
MGIRSIALTSVVLLAWTLPAHAQTFGSLFPSLGTSAPSSPPTNSPGITSIFNGTMYNKPFAPNLYKPALLPATNWNIRTFAPAAQNPQNMMLQQPATSPSFFTRRLY